MKLQPKTWLLCLFAGFLLISCDKDDDDSNDNNLTSQDRNFIMQASLGNTAEVQAGSLAKTAADSAVVKSFGEMMESDHTAAQNDLKTLGTSVNVDVADSVDDAHVALMDTLNTLSGRDFDSVYIMSQIKDHQTVIAQFQDEINSGNKTEVKNYANKYLPKLQMHLAKADSIATLLNFK